MTATELPTDAAGLWLLLIDAARPLDAFYAVERLMDGGMSRKKAYYNLRRAAIKWVESRGEYSDIIKSRICRQSIKLISRGKLGDAADSVEWILRTTNSANDSFDKFRAAVITAVAVLRTIDAIP